MHPTLVTQVAVRTAHHAHVLSHQIAAQTQLHNRMRASAALLALADRYLCELSEVIAISIGVTTAARAIKISARQQQHILERRAVAAKVDADLAAYRIADALSHPRYLKRSTRAGRFEIIGEVPETGRHLLVALKLVPSHGATSGEDEWWVMTAILLGKRKLRQLTNTDQLSVLPMAARDIDVLASRSAILEIIRLFAPPRCEWLLVDSVMEWSNGVGLPEDDPFRAAKAVVRQPGNVPTIVMLKRISADVQGSITGLLLFRGFVDQADRLQDSAVFLEHLVLHEIAHLILENPSESDCDDWAFERLAEHPRISFGGAA